MQSKSLAAAILLGVFFGPIGLLYASFRASVIVSVILLVVAFIPASWTSILFTFIWLLCPYLSVFILRKAN